MSKNTNHQTGISLSKPEPSMDFGYHFTAQYKSCTADIVVATQIWGSEKRKIFSVPVIESKVQNKGHAGGLIKRLESLAKQRRCNDIWYPTVMNPILAKMLKKRGYEPVNVGKHPKINEEVIAYVKVLRNG